MLGKPTTVWAELRSGVWFDLQGPSRFALDVLAFVKREERRLTGRRPRRRQLTATEKIEERVSHQLWTVIHASLPQDGCGAPKASSGVGKSERIQQTCLSCQFPFCHR